MLKTIPLLVLASALTLSSVASAEVTPKQQEIAQLAEQGEALAQAKLAAMYLLGREGVGKSTTKAVEWMLKAANQGLVEAQVSMAAFYDGGLGVKQDVKIATKWYEKAAAQGHEVSLALLGKNKAPKGSVSFSYKAMRLQASKQIPNEYAKRFLRK